MPITIICQHKDPIAVREALLELDSNLDIRIWPDDGNRADITMALCWRQPQGSLLQYPNLRCIASLGAGVDSLLADTQLPKDIPVVRIVDPQLADSMFDYVAAVVMGYCRHLDCYRQLQAQALWQPLTPQAPSDITVGIMGMGQLGERVAKGLLSLGFKVRGWSRSLKLLDGVESYAGSEQLTEFLSQTQVLVCLLPLTVKTCGILNQGLFSDLPQGACVVNVARGEHLVESDLIQALDSGHLRHATLDVFSQEPLPNDHAFWRREDITITPHCSSITSPQAAAPQLLENYRALNQDLPLINLVDVGVGY